MHITFGVRLEVYHQRVCIAQGRVQVVIYATIVQEQSKCVILALEFCIERRRHFAKLVGQTIGTGQRSIGTIERGLYIKRRQFARKALDRKSVV